jgi:hypothetical protein
MSTTVMQKLYGKRRGRRCYPFEFRVFVALNRLGHKSDAREIAGRFGVAVGFVCDCTEQLIEAIYELYDQLLTWPGPLERKKLCAAAFENRYNTNHAFAGAVCMIDGSHIRLHFVPPDVRKAYWCRKWFPSSLLQGVVDHTGLFRSILVGVPGSCNDSGMFNRSTLGTELKDRITRRRWLGPGEYLLGDSGYALKGYMMVPYSDCVSRQNAAAAAYNLCHASLRNPVERAFGRLKGG